MAIPDGATSITVFDDVTAMVGPFRTHVLVLRVLSSRHESGMLSTMQSVFNSMRGCDDQPGDDSIRFHAMGSPTMVVAVIGLLE